MGLKGVSPWIELSSLGFLIECSEDFQLYRWLYGKRLGIDLSVLLHILVARDIDANVEDRPEKVVDAILSLARGLQTKGVTPVYVFDGLVPPAKAAEHRRRHDGRESKRIEYRRDKGSFSLGDMFKLVNVHSVALRSQLMNSFRQHGITYIVAPYEADAQLAQLYREEQIDVILTNDSDLFLLGVKRLVVMPKFYDEFLLGRVKVFDMGNQLSPVNPIHSAIEFSREGYGDRIKLEKGAGADLQLLRGAYLYQVLKSMSCENERFKLLAMLAGVIGHDYNDTGIKGIGFVKAVDGLIELTLPQLLNGLDEAPSVNEYVTFLIQGSALRCNIDEESKKVQAVVDALLHGVVFQAPVSLPSEQQQLLITCGRLMDILHPSRSADIIALTGNTIENRFIPDLITGIDDPVCRKDRLQLIEVAVARFDGDVSDRELRSIPAWLVQGASLTVGEARTAVGARLDMWLRTRSFQLPSTVAEKRNVAIAALEMENKKKAADPEWEPDIRDPNGLSLFMLLVKMGLAKRANFPDFGCNVNPPALQDPLWKSDPTDITLGPSISMELINKFYNLSGSDRKKEIKARSLLNYGRFLNGFAAATTGLRFWIRCLVTPTMKTDIYSVFVMFAVSATGEIVKISTVRCTCAAAAGEHCHHSLFVIYVYYFMRHPQPLPPACTERQCTWNQKLTCKEVNSNDVRKPLYTVEFGSGDITVRNKKKQKTVKRKRGTTDDVGTSISTPTNKNTVQPKKRKLVPAKDRTGRRALFVPLSAKHHKELKSWTPGNEGFRRLVNRLFTVFPKSCGAQLWGPAYSK